MSSGQDPSGFPRQPPPAPKPRGEPSPARLSPRPGRGGPSSSRSGTDLCWAGGQGGKGGCGTYLTLAVRMRPACCRPVRAMYMRRISLVPWGRHCPGQRPPLWPARPCYCPLTLGNQLGAGLWQAGTAPRGPCPTHDHPAGAHLSPSPCLRLSKGEAACPGGEGCWTQGTASARRHSGPGPAPLGSGWLLACTGCQHPRGRGPSTLSHGTLGGTLGVACARCA